MRLNSESPNYSSKDVHAATGLTSRQLNDWDERGALPHERNGKEGWRRFSGRDIFTLMLCSEFRRTLGVPVERLKFLKEFMTQDGTNHLSAAINLMGVLGVGVWVMTDFEDTFVMDSELEFHDLWRLGYFGASNESTLAFVNVTPLVNKLLGALKEPITFEAHGRGYEILRSLDGSGPILTAEERFVVDLIRGGEVDKIEIVLRSGDVETIRTMARTDAAADLAQLLDREPYQRLTVTKKDGVVVNVQQELTFKPTKASQR
jgi:DNA-binding transcriptional MerR regulator